MSTNVRHSCVNGTRCSTNLTLNQRDLILNPNVVNSKSLPEPFESEFNFSVTWKSLRLNSNCAEVKLLSYIEVHKSAPNVLSTELAELSEVLKMGLHKLEETAEFIWQYYASVPPAKIEAVGG